MKKFDIDRLERLKNTRKMLEARRALWENDFLMVLCVQSIDEEIAALQLTLSAQHHRSKPATKGKRFARFQVKNLILWMAGMLRIFASRTGNAELKDAASIMPGELDQLRDSKFEAIGLMLLKWVDDIGVDALVEFGIDQDRLDRTRDAFYNLVPKLNDPRFTIAELKAMRALLPARFQRAREILFLEMRNILAPFKESHPDFWQEIEVSLQLINTGGGGRTGDDPAGDNKPA